ncbi:helix-turn-helix domain-containing protein [Variovorax sp. dw_954]|uniref:helix-turn-helix domain-containing protein n=1 Tax=Variovorax sp. dw_954 TaxID=2720078 RepID=UPI001BD25284|nr:helix-turn-helix domain-containing protein [Variovorax sp. dw_954]
MPFSAPSPARMPPLDYLLADQLEPPKRIARHLGVSLRTLQRWKANSNAPRTAYLALWFESRWGLSALHAQAFNEALHARAWVASLERECERLRDIIRVLESGQGYPAANLGIFHSI